MIPVMVTVARNRTINVDGSNFGPGSQVRIARKDIADLLQNGFLSDPDGALAREFGPSPPVATAGQLVRGEGRKPVAVNHPGDVNSLPSSASAYRK